MPQRKSIARAIRQAAHGEADETPAAPYQPDAAPPAPAAKARTRQGKKLIAAPVDRSAHRQLKMLAAEQERSAEELIREALRDLFAKYGKPAIA
jgi:hypothetical protein